MKKEKTKLNYEKNKMDFKSDLEDSILWVPTDPCPVNYAATIRLFQSTPWNGQNSQSQVS